jgi:hypothetical protein
MGLAGQGRSREAWSRWETALDRGLLDEFSARQLRPVTRDERRREIEVLGRLQPLDEQIALLAAKPAHTQDDDKQLEALRSQQSALRGEWVACQNVLGQKYKAYAGKPSTLEEVQKAMRADMARVGCLDGTKDHWACVVRQEGDPSWVGISGTGKDGAWNKDDQWLPQALLERLAARQATWETRAQALVHQRLVPLDPYLAGVKPLVVLPSQAMAVVPVEVLVASLPKAEALAEAKACLRNLNAEEVGVELDPLDRGGVEPLVDTSAKAPINADRSGLRPNAHPYYWAAFILAGDPS